MLPRMSVYILMSTVLTACTHGSPLSITAVEGLTNVYEVAQGVYSGSQPGGARSFDALEHLGVKTILSVDGAMPDVDAASDRGLRYVHLPIGYDGISPDRLAELTKLAETLEGPIYVHCHHGRHRGPAAAAALVLALDRCTPNEAVVWMKQAGTATNYMGLYNSIRHYQRPAANVLEQLPATFPSACKPTGRLSVMIALEEHHERLRQCANAQWQPPADQPDITPKHEALLLLEQLRELQRARQPTPGTASFDRALEEAVSCAVALHDALRADRTTEFDDLYRSLEQSCVNCHRNHRD